MRVSVDRRGKELDEEVPGADDDVVVKARAAVALTVLDVPVLIHRERRAPAHRAGTDDVVVNSRSRCRAAPPGAPRAARAQKAVVVDPEVLERVLRLRLGAAEVDALRADVVDVEIVDLDVSHRGRAVVVGLGGDAGEFGASHLDAVELEVARPAADGETREALLAELVVDEDPVGALRVRELPRRGRGSLRLPSRESGS